MQMTTTKITAEKSMSFIWINCVGASARLSLTLSVLEPSAGRFCGAEKAFVGREGGREMRAAGSQKDGKDLFCSFPCLHSSCFNIDKEAWVWKGTKRDLGGEVRKGGSPNVGRV